MISTREAEALERERKLQTQDLLEAAEFEMDVDDELDTRRRNRTFARAELERQAGKPPCKVCGRPGRFNDGFGYGQMLCEECHYSDGQPEHLRERWLSNPITVAFLIFVFGLVFFGTVIWVLL